MLSTILYQIIDKTPFRKFAERQRIALDQLNPERFYVENVRRIIGLPTKAAKYLCDMAVHQNLFRKRFGVRCPNCDRYVINVDEPTEIPELIRCELCELNEEETFEFESNGCIIEEYYTLNRN